MLARAALPVLLLCCGAALAETPAGLVPRTGLTFTKRTVGSWTRPNQPAVAVEQTRKLTVLTSDGRTARFHITPVGGPSVANTVADMVDSPDNTTTYFAALVTETVMRVRPPNQPDGARTVLLRMVLDCDKTAIGRFFSVAHAPAITVACTYRTDQDGVAGQPEPVQLTLSNEGQRSLSLPAGTFAVREIRMVREGRLTSDDLSSLDDVTGLVVKNVSKQVGPGFTSASVTELVALGR